MKGDEWLEPDPDPATRIAGTMGLSVKEVEAALRRLSDSRYRAAVATRVGAKQVLSAIAASNTPTTGR